ncbi:Tetratricopeptide repeat protein [compost metagenome]
MKLVLNLLKIALPLIVIFFLLKVHILLGIAAAVAIVAFLFIRNKSAFFAYLGNLNYQQGKEKEALMWLNKSAAEKNCKATHLLGFSFLLLRLGKLEQAQEILVRTERMNLGREEKMAYLTNASLLLWKQGRLGEATALLEEAHGEYKNTNLYGSLGYFYILSGDLDKALTFNQEGFEYNNKSAVIADNLGQTRLLRGEYEEALAVYEELAGQKPTFPEAYFNYGLVLEALGRTSEALEQMERALDYRTSLLSTVTHEEIKAKIAELEQKSGVSRSREEEPEEDEEVPASQPEA